MSDKKIKLPMEHLNIGEFNRGQSSKLIRIWLIMIRLHSFKKMGNQLRWYFHMNAMNDYLIRE